MSFKDKDHFSGHADRYEEYRPTYPDGLFAYLASLCPRHELAWDCATGNGQAAMALAPYFRTVVASDASQKQIDQARPRDNVQYCRCAGRHRSAREYISRPGDRRPGPALVSTTTVLRRSIACG